MNEVLYRKYRPGNFDELVAQDHVVDALKAALKQDSLGHAYLFYGSRGIGKTSVARLVASELGVSQNDTHEIDGASNRKIEDIRELRDAVQALPFDSKYKVYIIDEVHMLTKEAFNALLKTLEEPPAHAIFILATTELHKVPDTIISRCQVFTFERPTAETLAKHVITIGDKEGKDIDPAAAQIIARLGDGSFRDTLGVLQQVLSSVDDKRIGAEEVSQVTKSPSQELVKKLVAAVISAEKEEALAIIQTISEQDSDMVLVTEEVLTRLRAGLLLKHAPQSAGSLEKALTKEYVSQLQSLVQADISTLSAKKVMRFVEVLSQIKSAVIPTLALELAVIDLVE